MYGTAAPVAQPDRASVCGTEGRGFESLRVYHLSPVPAGTGHLRAYDRSKGFVPGWGEMSEWMKEHAWKACKWETVSGVRIPVSPPILRWSAQWEDMNRVRSERKQH